MSKKAGKTEDAEPDIGIDESEIKRNNPDELESFKSSDWEL